ncbi:transglycosylase domain-containing protein [Labrys monachus]|uniref:Biosynthetic peptidoglycan transglycosylase n=1 Tax=Labrys monachus TaxID=217067 RepID=A0ABU0FNP2_9HYPH|nr:transglycosylase domain-containing protein [Labrys monachus]MDQ0396230.1 monofunctional biosynthetic peptidoglycan transglycosylase [Labrys monachus]
MLGILLLCAIPFALTLVYAVVPPVSVPMLERYAAGQPVDRRWTALQDIAPVARFSVMASEDGRFCRHWGVDIDAISLVLEQSGDEGPSRGASTIAMQTAKNLYLWPLPTLVRKVFEIPLALWINLVWQKRRTLEVYLNIAEWGDGLYGIEAASQHYFRKPASRLNPREAALLAVALPNPIRRDAGSPSRRLRNLAALIVHRARNSAGYFDCVK